MKFFPNPVDTVDYLWTANQLALQGASPGKIDQAETEYNRKHSLSRQDEHDDPQQHEHYAEQILPHAEHCAYHRGLRVQPTLFLIVDEVIGR